MPEVERHTVLSQQTASDPSITQEAMGYLKKAIAANTSKSVPVPSQPRYPVPVQQVAPVMSIRVDHQGKDGHLEDAFAGFSVEEEARMAASLKQKGICYELAYNQRCTEGPGCPYSHREDDITRLKQQAAYECHRFYQKEIQDATASGDFTRCKAVLEEMLKCAKGVPPVSSQCKE